MVTLHSSLIVNISEYLRPFHPIIYTSKKLFNMIINNNIHISNMNHLFYEANLKYNVFSCIMSTVFTCQIKSFIRTIDLLQLSIPLEIRNYIDNKYNQFIKGCKVIKCRYLLYESDFNLYLKNQLIEEYKAFVDISCDCSQINFKEQYHSTSTNSLDVLIGNPQF